MKNASSQKQKTGVALKLKLYGYVGFAIWIKIAFDMENTPPTSDKTIVSGDGEQP